MKMDFVHIGFHKTASTYLQSRVFPAVENLDVINHRDVNADRWFYSRFIHADAHAFNRGEFLNEFAKIVHDRIPGSPNSIYAISEENLSGDIYTGLESRELMLRLRDVFGQPRILIVIRNQIDFILSAYGNHVIHGGTENIAQWLDGQETRFGRILNKVKYSSLIRDYKSTFGDEQVFVIQYEKLFDETSGIAAFLSMFGLSCSSVKHERINPGRSLKGNHLLSLLNKAGLGSVRGRQFFFHRFFKGDGSDREYVRRLLDNRMSEIYADNRKVEAMLGASLDSSYFY